MLYPGFSPIPPVSRRQDVIVSKYYSRAINRWKSKRPNRVRLGLKGEAGANLVGSLVQVLGIKGSTEAESDTRAEEDVVSQGGNTAVVDLGLYERISISKSFTICKMRI